MGIQSPSPVVWESRRSYEDFQRLHDELAQPNVSLRYFLPPMPAPSLLAKMLLAVSCQLREHQSRGLQHILQAVLQNVQADASLLDLQAMKIFFSPDTATVTEGERASRIRRDHLQPPVNNPSSPDSLRILRTLLLVNAATSGGCSTVAAVALA